MARIGARIPQHLKRAPGAMAVLFVLALALPSALAARTTSATATVDLAARRQVIQGFGSSERAWSDPHLSDSPQTVVPPDAQAEILTALYRDLGLTVVRDSIDAGIQPAPGAPFNFAKADTQAAYARQALKYGLKIFFPGPVYLEAWMQPNDPTSYVNWAMALLERWRSLGITPPYYSVINEPQVARDFPPQWLHDVVIQLGQRMRAAGMKTMLVIPDDENPIDAYRRAVAVLGDPAARKYVGAVAFHIYRIGGPSDWAKLRQLATAYKLPLWMTEWWTPGYSSYSGAMDWAVKMHQLLTIGSVNVVSYIWGFFGDWAGGASGAPISIHFDNGRYVSWSKTPVYYLTAQFSKFVRPGYYRVATASNDPNVLVSAYTSPKRIVVVAVNPGSAAQSLSTRITGGKVASSAAQVQTTATAGLRSLPAVRLRGRTLHTTLPPQSVTTYLLNR